MSAAELNRIKLDLIAWINQLSDVDLISFLEGLRSSRANQDSWDELSADQKKVVLQGLEDAEKENLMSSAEFWKRLKDA